MALAAHPVHGIAHLRAHFGDVVAASRDGTLELLIPDSVADRPCNISGQGAPVDRARSYVPLPHGKEGLVPSARMVVAGLLANGTPTIAQLATAAGQSVRTLQRRLAEEGMTFSQLVEDVRHERAMAGIAAGDTSAGEIAARLGYRQPSSLTRAVRRWEGSTPRSMRQMASRPGKAT
jgi:AraC-like DNA-binding protein